MHWQPINEAMDFDRDMFYAVNSSGGVAQMTRWWKLMTVIGQRSDGRGYLCCDIKIKGKWRTKKVHHLVMGAFKGPTPKGYHIDHLDGDSTNNALDNLRWRKAGENSADCRRGSRRGVKPLTEEQRDAVAVLIHSGWGTAKIARSVGISETTVRRLRKEYEA